MKKLIKMYNEKYGDTLGVIDDDFNKEQMYRIYYFIKNNCDDKDIQDRLKMINLDKPKTLEQQLTKLEGEHNKGGGTDPTIKSDVNNIKDEVNKLNTQYKDIANEKTIINLNSFNGDTITEKFKNAIKYGGDYSIFFTGIIEINDTINVPDNTRLNLIGNPDGRKNKSIIKFTPLNDKPMFLGENFQEGKNPTDKLYINMKNVTIQTNKNNGKSKNTVFKGVRILESTFDSIYINNFNKILSSCSLGYLSRFINCNIMEIGRAFFADNTICGDNIITDNYFSGNSSMPIVENGETTYRCPDFCDSDSEMGSFAKNIINNNWFEKMGKIFKGAEKLTICGNVFDYIYTLGEITDSTFTGNLITNIYKDNFLEQFQKYGNPHKSFIFPNYIFSAVDSNSVICNNKFDTKIDEYTKGYKLGGGKNFSNRKSTIENIIIKDNAYGRDISKNNLVDFSNIKFTYIDDAYAIGHNLTKCKLGDLENFSYDDLLYDADTHKFLDGESIKYKDLLLYAKLNTLKTTDIGEDSNLITLYNNGNPYFYMTENIIGNFKNISTAVNDNCKWYLANGNIKLGNDTKDDKLSVYMTSTRNAEIKCETIIEGGCYYRIKIPQFSNFISVKFEFLDGDSSILKKTFLNPGEYFVKILNGCTKLRITYTISFVANINSYVYPIIINKNGNPIGDVLISGNNKYLRTVTDCIPKYEIYSC